MLQPVIQNGTHHPVPGQKPVRSLGDTVLDDVPNHLLQAQLLITGRVVIILFPASDCIRRIEDPDRTKGFLRFPAKRSSA